MALLVLNLKIAKDKDEWVVICDKEGNKLVRMKAVKAKGKTASILFEADKDEIIINRENK